MKKKKEVKKVEKKVVKKPYSLKVRVNDVEFKTDAKNLTEALTEFVESDKFPVGAKTIAYIEYSKGKNKGKQIWQTPKARRLFRIMKLKPAVLEVWATKFEEELK